MYGRSSCSAAVAQHPADEPRDLAVRPRPASPQRHCLWSGAAAHLLHMTGPAPRRPPVQARDGRVEQGESAADPAKAIGSTTVGAAAVASPRSSRPPLSAAPARRHRRTGEWRPCSSGHAAGAWAEKSSIGGSKMMVSPPGSTTTRPGSSDEGGHFGLPSFFPASGSLREALRPPLGPAPGT